MTYTDAAIRRWLTPPDGKYEPEYYKRDFETSEGNRANGTCAWLTEEERFKDWCDPISDKDFLWLCGGPGTGKTVLTGSVIHHLREMAESDQATPPWKISVLYFFCNDKANDPHTTQLAAIYRSLIFQLWQSLGDTDPMMKALEMILRSCHAHACDDVYMTEVLRSIFKHPSTRTYLIIDALDECENPNELMECLRKLNKENEQRIKIFLSCRPNEKSEHDVSSDLSIVISQETTRSDLKLYTEDAVNRAVQSRRIKIGQNKLKEEIVSTLVEKANGMCVTLKLWCSKANL